MVSLKVRQMAGHVWEDNENVLLRVVSAARVGDNEG